MPTAREVTCPQCGSTRTELTSEYGATACRAIYRCADCLEPFDHGFVVLVETQHAGILVADQEFDHPVLPGLQAGRLPERAAEP